MDAYHQALSDLREPTKSLRPAISQAWAGFLALHGDTTGDGEVPGHRRVPGDRIARRVISRLLTHSGRPPGAVAGDVLAALDC